MQDIGMEYNSPTLGLYFMYPDYIELLSNLKYYLTDARIEFVENSKYPIGDERRAAWSHWYPIGLLGSKVEIHFLHYHSEKEAAENGTGVPPELTLTTFLLWGCSRIYAQRGIL